MKATTTTKPTSALPAVIKELRGRRKHVNGECWLDSNGEPIQAHGGGVMFHDGAYYWYGENRAGAVRRLGDHDRRAAVGVSCYRSLDLLTWENLGVVLSAVEDPAHELYLANVIERPKVIFNRETGKFVMWMHVDSPDYKAARAGVAVADDPAGPFTYHHSFRPNGFESRDQTIFQDEDGAAYHICASDHNRNTLISRLSDDYLRPTGEFKKAFLDRSMEAFAFCKREGKYWMIASGCTGWKPNEARCGVADDLLGDWQELANPCHGANAALTFGGQSTFIIPPRAPRESYVAMFDVWRPEDLATSGYIWLPMQWPLERLSVEWAPTWEG